MILSRFLKSVQLALGKQLASFLAGSWRASMPAADITAEDLDRLTPLLLGAGAAGLGWWRIRDSHLREMPAAFELRQAYRFQSVHAAIHAAIHAQEIPEVFSLLRSARIEPPSQEIAVALYEADVDTVVSVASPEIAESAKLLGGRQWTEGRKGVKRDA